MSTHKQNAHSKKSLLATTALTVACIVTAPAYADPGLNDNPTGFNLQSGAVTQAGAGTANMSLDQTSDRSVINWTTFDIGASATTTFNFHKSTDIAVNRVTGSSNPSQIYGTLKAQSGGTQGGRIVLLDKNGTVFGANSKVNVGALVVSTGDLADAAGFAANGSLVISNIENATAGARIDNRGTINLTDGGLLAFVAPYVTNSGTINATLGTVTLASGSKATVSFTGNSLVEIAVGDAFVENAGGGKIVADGGTVTLSANTAKALVTSAVNLEGVVQANTFKAQNGKIVLSGGGNKTRVAGTLSASDGTTVSSTTVDFTGGDTHVDKGVLSVKANTVNLDGSIRKLSDNSLFTALDGTASTVNVLSPSASIQQGVSLAANGGTVAVSGGDYFGNITIDRALTLQGDGTKTHVVGSKSKGKVITVAADNVTIRDLDIDGGKAGSDYGVFAQGVSNLKIIANNIHDMAKDAIHIERKASLRAKNLAVSENRIDGIGRDGVQVNDTDGVSIADNVIGGVQNNNAGIFHYGVAVRKSSDIVVSGNNVYDTETGDGINVVDSSNLRVIKNTVHDIGQDGIDVENTRGTILIDGNIVFETVQNGIEVSSSGDSAPTISNNLLTSIGENGISAIGTKGVNIHHNGVREIGFGAYYGVADGIHVRDSDGATISQNGISTGAFNESNAGRDGIHVVNSNDVSITQNVVVGALIKLGNFILGEGFGAGRDGIFVSDSSGADISDNFVLGGNDQGAFGAGRDGIRLENVDKTTANGNTVSVVENVDVSSLVQLGESGTPAAKTASAVCESECGVGGGAYNDGLSLRNGVTVTLSNNTIDHYGDDGVQVSGSKDVTISSNVITGNNDFLTGIRLWDDSQDESARIKKVFGIFSGNGDITLTDNVIAGNGIGLNASAFDNGRITLAANTFTDNTVGAWISSGTIDLTGKGNTFNGGDTAWRFDRASTFTPSNTDFMGPFLFDAPAGNFAFADLSLVNNTLGSTVYNGQTTWYVDFESGAFFDPGKPTVIDGTQSVYDGVNGGLMTSSQLASIEDKLHDFVDDPTEGLIFPGFTNNNLDNSDIFRLIDGGNFLHAGPTVIVTGLPRTGGGNPTSPANLADIEPAAGGDNSGLNTAAQFANLEPSAGGDSTAVACWNKIGASLTGQNVVSINLSEDAETVLTAAACDKGGI